MKTVCINCPVGCLLNIEKEGDKITVTGNACLRGVKYGEQEIICPKRVVTSLIKTKNKIYSVKTDNTVNKSQIFEILDFIAKIKLENDNFKIGDIIVENILSSGTNLVITGVNKL